MTRTQKTTRQSETPVVAIVNADLSEPERSPTGLIAERLAADPSDASRVASNPHAGLADAEELATATLDAHEGYQRYEISDHTDVMMIGGIEAPVGGVTYVIGDSGWGRSLRRFARASVWAVPGAAICIALAGMWGRARPATPTWDGQSPGTWLMVVVLGLWFGLVGVIALTALVSATPGRPWALFGLFATLAGTILLGPVLGFVAVARPSVTRSHLAEQTGAPAAASLQSGLLQSSVGRWLHVGSLVLLAVGWLAIATAILASGVLSRLDGWLVYIAVGVAVIAGYLSWEFLLVVAAMVLLAAGLGTAWTACRLTPDGRTPDDD